MDPNSFGNCKASRTLVSLIEGDRRMRRFVSNLWTQFNREIASNFYWSKERHHAELVEELIVREFLTRVERRQLPYDVCTHLHSCMVARHRHYIKCIRSPAYNGFRQ
jgi:hypothetical protein